ncbi:hypothetical protein HCN44_010482 [Aphidius gifuensis]|uniref:Tetraspanin n=1 Tax=Aphidius gifuensis TaxID=684658 RepID=A0A834XVP9_APHGI|nr:CD151 antigen-like [Aphidius gifuensis]KAF7991681.1 hypothetical protein HCN44_010482 [Aphidius gifuensis]
MRRGDSINDEETDTEGIDGDYSESEESVVDKKIGFFGILFNNLSIKNLPKKCVKFTFITINTMTCLLGISTVVISIWMLADTTLTLRLTGQKLFVTILLIIGVFGASISSLGIYSLIKQKKKLMSTYIFFHSIFLGIIFFSSIMSASMFDRVIEKIHQDMKNTIIKYRSLDWVTEAWDNTQQYLKCCGIKSSNDWTYYRMEIPQSCCSKSIEHCLEMSDLIAFESGCLKSTYLMLRSNIDMLAIVTILISILSGASIFFGLGVKKRFKVSRYVG